MPYYSYYAVAKQIHKRLGRNPYGVFVVGKKIFIAMVGSKGFGELAEKIDGNPSGLVGVYTEMVAEDDLAQDLSQHPTILNCALQ